MTNARAALRWVGALALFGVACGGARGDTVMFKDGRFFEVPKLAEQGGGYVATFGNGSVTIDKALVKDVFILQQGGGYEPKNEDERKKVEKGLLPFDGKWMTAAQRDQILAKRNAAAKAAIEEYRKHQNWRDRYTASTKHFDFEYTVPPETAADYMDLFEVYFETFSKEWGVRQPKGEKLKVCFYHDEKDFLRIGNTQKGVLGYFRFVDPIELNFFYARRDERLTLDVLFHETNHYLFHLYVPDTYKLASWIDEGMAEYYGASEWDPKAKKMSIGHIQEGRLVNLKDAIDGDELQDLRGLMKEVRIDAMQYAWAWSLNYMLMESKTYRDKYRKYIERLAKDKTLDREDWPGHSGYKWVKPDAALDLFQKTLGIKDLEAFEQDWYGFIRQLEVKSHRGYHRAAMYCVQWDRPIRAEVYFKKAIELGSKDPDTYEEYGQLLVRQGKAEDAIGVLEKGIALDPLNPYLYLQLGTAWRVRGGTENEAKGKQYQRLAIEIDPNDPGLIWNSDVLLEN